MKIALVAILASALAGLGVHDLLQWRQLAQLRTQLASLHKRSAIQLEPAKPAPADISEATQHGTGNAEAPAADPRANGDVLPGLVVVRMRQLIGDGESDLDGIRGEPAHRRDRKRVERASALRLGREGG